MSRRDFLVAAGAGAVAAGMGAASTDVGAVRAGPQSRLPLLKCTINGGRARGSHPALPTTPEECADTAREVVEAGAGAVHVHVRARDGSESIQAEDLARTLSAMRAETPGTPIGVSTHFRILGDVARRREAVAAWTELPDFASVNFHEEGAPELARQLIARGIGVEAGLFNQDAARVCVDSGVVRGCLRLMIEVGGDELDVVLERVAEIEAVLDAGETDRPRLLHGSGGVAWALVDEAARRGYQTRVGFEDTFQMPDGRTARDNAEMVVEAGRRIRTIVGSL